MTLLDLMLMKAFLERAEKGIEKDTAERTRIVTVQATYIDREGNAFADKKRLEEAIKKEFGEADDIVIDIKDFELDGQNENKEDERQEGTEACCGSCANLRKINNILLNVLGDLGVEMNPNYCAVKLCEKNCGDKSCDLYKNK